MTNKKDMKRLFTTILSAIAMTAGAQSVFTTPVIKDSAPDPTVIKADNGFYYLYATEDLRNVPVYKSADLRNWQLTGTAFDDYTRPTWNPKGGIWAPDINRINGKYVLYYSKSEWGGDWTCGIGVATSDTPEGHFTDHGSLFLSREIGVRNSIDPFYIENGGRRYLFWGSFHGIYGIELTADGLHIKPGARKRRIAGSFMEGTYIHKRGGYYYLFGSEGACCAGERSTYRVVYGRSKSLFGPYRTHAGKKMLSGHYDVFLEGDSVVAGPGHNAEIVTDDEGRDWMPVHGFQRKHPEYGRQVWLIPMQWKDGWPEVIHN